MSFLSAMLPTIAGAGLMAASGGAINPMTAGLILGGLQTARTGSVQKGLMAGLGAYGGAGIGQGLMTAGEAGFTNEALKNAGANLSAEEAMTVQQKAAQDFAQKNAFEKLGTGIGSMGSTAGQQAFLGDVGGSSGLMKTGLAATAPMLMANMQQPQIPAGDNTMPQRLRYDQGTATPFPQPDVPGYDNLGQDFGRQRNFFPNAGYQQITPEEARSIRGYAAGGYMGGGPVEAMSQANALGENTGYPQADITGHAYATPWQTPVSQNVVQGTADTGVNRITGQMLAGGGITGEGNLDLHIPLYFGGSGSFGGASANGYQAAGSGASMQTGFRGYNNAPGQSAGATRQDMSSFAPTQSADAFAQMAAAGQTGAPNSTTDAGAAAAFTGLGPIGNQAGLSSRLSNYVPDPTLGGGINLQGKNYFAQGGIARGGLSDLGGYSDGGRLLRGPGDGVSDSIPAVIGKKKPARLADGEFVVPARIVSELGNGSTEAGARKLYAMLDRVQSARKKSIGKGKVAHNSRADKYLPA